jgi:hypothetical protein
MSRIIISDRALLQWVSYRANLDLEHMRTSAIFDINIRARGFQVKRLTDCGLVEWFERQGASLEPHRMLLRSATRQAASARAPHVVVGVLIFGIAYEAPCRGFERVWMLETATLEGVIGHVAVPAPLIHARAT